MRSFAIAAVVTGLVAGAGYVVAPAPRPLSPAAMDESPELPDAGAFEANDLLVDGAPAASGSRGAPESPARVYYQWTDERGAVRFARSLDEVPAAWRERAGKVEVDASAFLPASSRAAARTRRSSTTRASAADEPRRSVHDVTVYTAPWCGWCRKTLAFLDAREIDYVNKDIEADEDWAEELEQKTGSRSIPLVVIDGSMIRGYNPSEMTALLE